MRGRAVGSGWLWGGWLGVLVLLTTAFVAVRGRIDRVHVALAFLVVVLGGSATGGRRLGRTLALLAYLAFHFFFIEHFDSLQMAKPMDALVLIAFLTTAFIAEHLVTQAQAQADEARRRTAEVERLAVLGAETLSAGRAEDAVRTITEVIRTSLAVDQCAVVDGEPAPTTSSTQAGHVLDMPLTVHGHRAGTLRLSHHAPIMLSPEQRRFLDVLSYYAALAIERVRLVADAERSEALQTAESLRESLVAGLSHDLRTPLTAIKALANRLAATGVPEAIAIERAVDRLDRLAGDLVDLSRMNAGALPLLLEFNMASDLIGAVLQRSQLGERATRISVVPLNDSDDSALAGHFDFVQSLRVLGNLLENALKYAPTSSDVELSVMRVGEVLEFRVADRGPGIVLAERDRIFDPFYRVPGIPADAGGTGLGLAIARRLAREQGGEVWHEARPGGGSVFVFSVPFVDPSVIDPSGVGVALKNR